MVSFDDPVSDAREASAALRGLAHATRNFRDPSSSYVVLGDVLSAASSLRQVVQQLAEVHQQHAEDVRSETGSAADGRTTAVAVEAALRRATNALHTLEQELDDASGVASQIVWPHPRRPQPQAPALSMVKSLSLGNGQVAEPGRTGATVRRSM